LTPQLWLGGTLIVKRIAVGGASLRRRLIKLTGCRCATSTQATEQRSIVHDIVLIYSIILCDTSIGL